MNYAHLTTKHHAKYAIGLSNGGYVVAIGNTLGYNKFAGFWYVDEEALSTMAVFLEMVLDHASGYDTEMHLECGAHIYALWDGAAGQIWFEHEARHFTLLEDDFREIIDWMREWA